MAYEELVQRTFRHASGALARGINIDVVERGTSTIVDSVVTDQLGQASLYLPAGHYDWVAFGTHIQFDVVEPGVTPAIVHVQSVPAATWVIQHYRNTKPAIVLVLDSDPSESVYTDVTYPDLDTAVVEWDIALTGSAYIG